MSYIKRFFALLVVLALILLWALGSAVADPTDEATLGGQDSDRLYRWRVTLDGHLIPGADGDTNIGDSTHKVNNIYAEDTVLTDNIQFQTTIYASGHNSGATTVSSSASYLTSAMLAFGLIQKEMTIGGSADDADEISDGSPGQMVTIRLIQKDSTYNYVIKEDTGGSITSTGWTEITFDTVYDSITLLWLDDTYGWIIVANNGCMITI